MITLTLGQIADMFASQALHRFSTISFPVKTAYLNMRLIKSLNEEFTDFEAKRLELCKKHGNLEEKSNTYLFTPESEKAFHADFAELRAIEIEVKFDPIKISNLPAKCEIQTGDLIYLASLFVE